MSQSSSKKATPKSSASSLDNNDIFIKNTLRDNLNDLFNKYTALIATECKVNKNELNKIWDAVLPETTSKLEEVISHEDKKNENIIERLTKKEEEAKLPKCPYTFGPKAKKPNSLCGAPCKDGNDHCNKHKNQNNQQN